MQSLLNIPIQRKLRLVILVTCSAALIVACSALFGLQYFVFKRDFARDLSAVAGIIASNSTAALSSNDKKAAEEILGVVHANPHISAAAIIQPDGTVFAEAGEPLFLENILDARFKPGLHKREGEWLYIESITLDSKLLGTLILNPDYQAQANRLFRVYAGILVAVLAISFLVAVLISWHLEPLILLPIQNLAQTVWAIAGRNDYSVRAEKFVEDELGSFTESFNAMLEQIETRDRALRHEIAERKRAEEELQYMQDRLVEASRQAGMAEVATGVLHNVGNVLNSVNVSATLIAEKLHHSKIGNLTRATDLLQDKKGNLAEFLTNDPKGKILPGYIAKVSKHLARERIEALKELELLGKNIEHIKDIVARQQNYARVTGLHESLALDELINDAIGMNAGSFERHGMTVIREFEEVPPAAVDKHKVLQILINLLRNAKHAISEADPAERRLTVQLRAKEHRFAEVRVCDNGVGIAPENLTKIFSHGFTTREGGHGFGLHSAGVAAQEMGGRLSAESAGPGQGAVFVLELPLSNAPDSGDVISTTVAA